MDVSGIQEVESKSVSWPSECSKGGVNGTEDDYKVWRWGWGMMHCDVQNGNHMN